MNCCLKMKDHDTTGKLIAFCGLDGSGKTTLINLTLEYLRDNSVKCELTKQPSEAFRKSDIFRKFQDSNDYAGYDYRAMSIMAAADRLQHVNSIIVPWLSEGYTVISDRYFYSCLANLWARGYDSDLWIYEIASHIVKPDIAFFLDVPVEIAVERIRRRSDEKNKFIDIPLQHRLREQYLNIARSNNGVIINTDRDPKDAFKEAKKHLLRLNLL